MQPAKKIQGLYNRNPLKGSSGLSLASDEVLNEKNGNIIALACGPLKKARYVNPKIEKELVEFKKEIEEKFEKCETKNYQFLRPK